VTQQALDAFAYLTAAVQAQQAAIARRDECATVVANVQARLDALQTQLNVLAEEKKTAAAVLQESQVGITAAVTRTYTASQAWVRAFTTQPDPSI
jgi:hypothetical protein